ncbi:BZIP transcription factor [Rhynchospora pubera]|uniref:BZIP transcription factor n=2 Tax=Rhynchospora pubera TaxID=906938 RepID=A0AAV8G4G7_9POAL|nr:BZIP transcription factor [Rhynchospora pubera]KAJ4799150.1 BZIP transcription factor [Rhynchospora pubera]
MEEEGSVFPFEEYDIGLLLSSFDFEPPAPITDSDSPVSVTSDPIPESDPIALSIDDLERHLMSDEYENQEVNEGIEERFLDGVFVNELFAESGGSNQEEKSDVDDSVEKDQDKERDSDDSNDPVAKKIKRQIRNRDSARSSRERKKQYIKELEMKSRFLESECKRLNYTLQCFMSENMALRQSLHSQEIAAGKGKKPHHADAAMRESAVLFSESRQLGSLHWLVSIVWCLLLSLLAPHQVPPRTLTSPKRGPAPVPKPVAVLKRPESEIDLRYRSEELFLLRQCYKGLRLRMKPGTLGVYTGLEVVY